MVAGALCVTEFTWRALVAARHNPILRNFYLRLRAAGKPAKVPLTATMRKLLIVLNSSLKCDPTYA
jgi:transposase